MLAAFAVALLCLFSHLGAIGLVGPDEPRYAWIARSMAETGDWVTPRLYAAPWFEKPILYYWTAAFGFALHLPDEWAARLPSALAALLAVLAISWLGWKGYGWRAQPLTSSTLLAPVIFATCVGAVSFARAAGPDMLFAASLALAMAAAAAILFYTQALSVPSPVTVSAYFTLAAGAFFGAFLGLAALAKGPAAIVLAGGAIGIWAFATGQWRAALRLLHPAAIAAFSVVALPWYILCAMRNPGFVRIFIFRHNFERYLSNEFQHRQPVWFFLPIAILALLPWAALLFQAAGDMVELWSERNWKRSPAFFFACWALFPIVFFSFSQSKLPGYILPAVPPLALLAAISLDRTLNSGTGRGLAIAVGITWIALGAAVLRGSSRLPPHAQETVGRLLFTSAIAAVVAGMSLSVLAVFRVRVAWGLSVVLVLVFVQIAGLQVLPALDPYISARHHAEFLRHDRHLERLFTFRLERSWNYGFAFYFRRQLPEWSATDPEPALVLTTPAGLAEITKLGRFHGTLDEPYTGVLYVPVGPAPR
jgi:4-amino-4-deoxy-L-arabinose transferase-like glycosyltransferase